MAEPGNCGEPMSRFRNPKGCWAGEGDWRLPGLGFGGFFMSFEKVTAHPRSRQTKMPQAKAANWRLDTIPIMVKKWNP